MLYRLHYDLVRKAQCTSTEHSNPRYLHFPSSMLVQVGDKLQIASSGLGKAMVSQQCQTTICYYIQGHTIHPTSETSLYRVQRDIAVVFVLVATLNTAINVRDRSHTGVECRMRSSYEYKGCTLRRDHISKSTRATGSTRPMSVYGISNRARAHRAALQMSLKTDLKSCAWS